MSNKWMMAAHTPRKQDIFYDQVIAYFRTVGHGNNPKTYPKNGNTNHRPLAQIDWNAEKIKDDARAVVEKKLVEKGAALKMNEISECATAMAEFGIRAEDAVALLPMVKIVNLEIYKKFRPSEEEILLRLASLREIVETVQGMLKGKEIRNYARLIILDAWKNECPLPKEEKAAFELFLKER